MARGSREFADEILASVEALREFQQGLSDAAETANELATSGQGGQGGGDAERGGSGTRRTNRAARARKGPLDRVAKRAGQAVLGVVAAGIFSAGQSIRSGGDITSGLSASLANAAAFVIPGLGQKIDAANLAVSRTAAITAPLARFGVATNKADRERQFQFERGLAEAETKELAEVRKLGVSQVESEGLDALIPGDPSTAFDRTADEIQRTAGQTQQILLQILKELTEGNSKRGGR